MQVLEVVCIVKLSVEASIIVSNNHLAITSILSQMIESFAEVAHLVAFIIMVADKGNLLFLVGR